MRLEILFRQAQPRQIETVADENPCDLRRAIQTVEQAQTALRPALNVPDPQALIQEE